MDMPWVTIGIDKANKTINIAAVAKTKAEALAKGKARMDGCGGTPYDQYAAFQFGSQMGHEIIKWLVKLKIPSHTAAKIVQGIGNALLENLPDDWKQKPKAPSKW